MWKVAVAHFGLTLCVVLTLLFWHGLSASKGGPFNPALIEQNVKAEIWFQFWFSDLILLQPVSYLSILVLQQIVQHPILSALPIWLQASFVYLLIFLTALLWSYCFGWIFVKLDTWLNHFPVLGKKVF